MTEDKKNILWMPTFRKSFLDKNTGVNTFSLPYFEDMKGLEDLNEYFKKLFGERTLKIKIEVDINPPLKFKTEQKLLMLPFSFLYPGISL